MNVLVTDGENRSALAVTRSLGRQGCKVWVTSREKKSISASSRYCFRSLVVPDPQVDTVGYTRAIKGLISSEDISVVFPMTEQSVYCLNGIRQELGEVVLACAPRDMMDDVSDKSRLFKLAEQLQVPIPDTVYISDNKVDYASKRNAIGPYPVVVKPAFSKLRMNGRILSAGVMYASNRDELDLLYDTKEILRYPSLIQELIIGEGTGLFTLFNGNRHLALFAHRRLLEKPPSGGVSVLSESVKPDEGMLESAGKLLTAVGWKGIAMVEFKRDSRDGTAKLMEINGRFWGSLQLAIASGVNFPALSLEYYLNHTITSICPEYKVGHRLKWQLGMLDHILIRLKKPNHKILHKGLPSIRSVVYQLIPSDVRSNSSDVFDRQDLKPLIRESIIYLQNLVR